MWSFIAMCLIHLWRLYDQLLLNEKWEKKKHFVESIQELSFYDKGNIPEIRFAVMWKNMLEQQVIQKAPWIGCTWKQTENIIEFKVLWLAIKESV